RRFSAGPRRPFRTASRPAFHSARPGVGVSGGRFPGPCPSASAPKRADPRSAGRGEGDGTRRRVGRRRPPLPPPPPSKTTPPQPPPPPLSPPPPRAGRVGPRAPLPPPVLLFPRAPPPPRPAPPPVSPRAPPR